MSRPMRELTPEQKQYANPEDRVGNPEWFNYAIRELVNEWELHRARVAWIKDKAERDNMISHYDDAATLLSFLHLLIQEFDGSQD